MYKVEYHEEYVLELVDIYQEGFPLCDICNVELYS